MRKLLGFFEAATTRRPGLLLVGLAAVTVALALFARTARIEVDITRLGREDSLAMQAMQRVQSEFGDPTAMVQVILDAGAEGDILSAEGLRALARAEELAVSTLGVDIRADEAGNPLVQSLRAGIGQVAAAQGLSVERLPDARAADLATRVLALRPELAALLSNDFDAQAGEARATFLVALLDPALSESERTASGERVARAFGISAGSPTAEFGPARVAVFSSGLFTSGLARAVRGEVPQLFGLALLVVVVILGLTYRTAFDVAIGMVGLIVTVVWTFGIIALLGPANLGLTGPFSQLGVIVPVLLVGLGIDYSVHLTSRYREQRSAGDDAAPAAANALRTVGTALVLATVGTAIGFATNALAPIPMIADFGVFVAIGVVCAFVVMGLLVPAARVLRDRRRVGVRGDSVRSLGLAEAMRAPARMAVRAPLAGLALAAALVALSLVAAGDLRVEFNRAQFIPEGSDVEKVLALQGELFGANLNEVTFVLIDGDFANADLANAVWEAQQDLAGIEGVRTVNGVPQVRSIVSLAAAARQRGAPAPSAWTGDGFSGGADMAAVYDMLRRAVGEAQVSQLLTSDLGTGLVQVQSTAGDLGARPLQAAIERAFAPVEELGAEVTVTSEPIVMGEMSDDLSAFQSQAIGLTLSVVLVLLSGYYWLAYRRILLGPIAMIPAAVAASLVLGVMWLLGISFNALTATLTAVAIGIGVPYGIHVVNRFAEASRHAPSAETAIRLTLESTGGALAGSALTTLGAFVVLAFSGLPPIQNLGLLGAVSIALALLAALLVEPGALVLWYRLMTPDRAAERRQG
jgi:hydrophobe/amphiphile efflux-3 (HAE3) family protein